MTSTVNLAQCNHLRSCSVPHFASERAEIIPINEPLNPPDHPISESTLNRRSLQLRDQLSPIDTLPIEVMSYIFQLVVGPESYGRSNFGYYRECLRRALVLSSVSPHFRYFAFGTPELWNRIPLHITESKASGEVSSLLQHCIARAPNVTICVSDGGRDHDHADDGGRNVHSVIETLLTLDTTRKVKAFHLYGSNYISTWISRLNSSSFPMIETLIITYKRKTEHFPIFDFGTLDNLTRVDIDGAWLNFPIIVPPSVNR